MKPLWFKVVFLIDLKIIVSPKGMCVWGQGSWFVCLSLWFVGFFPPGLIKPFP